MENRLANTSDVFIHARLDQALRALVACDEVDFTANINHLTLSDEGVATISGTQYNTQPGFIFNLAKFLGYPLANFKSDLQADRLSDDLNSLINLHSANVNFRLQRGELFAVYPNTKRPAYSADILTSLQQQFQNADIKKLDITDCDVMYADGKLRVRAETRVNTGLKNDPSIVALYYENYGRTYTAQKLGFQSGLLLKRTACDNSTVLRIDEGWTGAISTPRQSLDRLAPLIEVPLHTYPVLPDAYKHMVETRITTEKTFVEACAPITALAGKRVTAKIFNLWVTQDEIKKKFNYDAAKATDNGKETVYDAFNDATYFGRQCDLKDEIQYNISVGAGNMLKSYLKEAA